MNLFSSRSAETTQVYTSLEIKVGFHSSSFKSSLSKFVIQFAKPMQTMTNTENSNSESKSYTIPSSARTNLSGFLYRLSFLILLTFGFVGQSSAADYFLKSASATAPQTAASWNTLANGTGTNYAGTFVNTDNFIIPSGVNATLGATWTVGSSGSTNAIITIQVIGSLTISSGFTLTLQGRNNAGSSTTLTVDGTIIFSGTAANQVVTNAGANSVMTFNLSSGATLRTVNTAGVSGATTNSILTTGFDAVNLNIAANYEFNGAAQSTTGLPATVNNLTLSGSGAKTLINTTTSISGNLALSGSATATTVVGLTIGGTLTVGNGTTFDAAGFALTVNGATTVGGGTSGTLTVSSATGAKLFTGLVTVSAGATWNNSGNSAVSFAGGITNNGTFTAGSGVHTFQTNAQNLTGTLSIPSVTVTTITVTNNNTLTVGTDLTGTGGLTQAASATLNIGGTSGITTLTASAASNTVNYSGGAQTVKAVTYKNLTISGGSNKTISSDITIDGQMTFISGYVVPSTPLTPQTVIFTANGVLNGTPTVSSFIRGCMVQKVVSASSSFTFPVGGSSKGYRPIAIGSVSGATTFTAIYKEETPSNVIVRRTNQSSENLQDISTFEYWDLGHSSSAGSITAAVTLNWAPYTSVTSANSGNLRLAHYDGTQWENSSPTPAFRAYDNTNKNITITGVSSFSPFTMGSISAAALPVTLTSFSAKPTPDNKVSLGWVTSSEQVNKGFRIERQTTAETGKFAQIGFVATKAKDGNSQSMLTYNFIDNAPKMGASSFYRLVQEDLDGKLTYSDIRVVRLNGQSVSMVFPNPSNGVVNISRTADGKKMNIQVIDQSGKIVSQAYNITNANYTMSILQSGIYSVKLMYPETGEQSIQRIVVQR